ncbi:hypothetical protein QQF64_034654, partial [Cirrhinus molitorella]
HTESPLTVGLFGNSASIHTEPEKIPPGEEKPYKTVETPNTIFVQREIEECHTPCSVTTDCRTLWKLCICQYEPENILLGEEKPFKTVKTSRIVPTQRKIAERHVSVINMISLHETDSVHHLIDQLLGENKIHAFVFVVQLGKLTGAEDMGFEWLQRVFGDEVLQFVMILFTYEKEVECDTIMDDIENKIVLEQLLEKCGGRYQTCNKMMNNQSEMSELMDNIEHLFKQNQQQCYTADIYNTVPRQNIVQNNKDEIVSDLRIVLLGKNLSENCTMGNIILGKAMFDSKAPSNQVQRQRRMHKAIINAPHLLQPHLSDHQITEAVRECMYLSDPGPHVIILVLRNDQCSREDQKHTEKVLDSFPNRVYEHTMVLTLQEPDSAEPTAINDVMKKIIKKCFDRHYQVTKSSSADLREKLENFSQMNSGRYLVCDELDGSENTINQQLTDADKMGLEWLQRVFGDDVLQFVMILFTYVREEECDTKVGDLKDNLVLQQLLDKCEGRYHTCNKMMNNQSEMRDLMNKIEHLFNENQQQHYTGEIRRKIFQDKKENDTITFKKENMEHITSMKKDTHGVCAG